MAKSNKLRVLLCLCAILVGLGAITGGAVAIYKHIPVEADVFLPRPDRIRFIQNGQPVWLTEPQIDVVYNAFMELTSHAIWYEEIWYVLETKDDFIDSMELAGGTLEFCYAHRQHFKGKFPHNSQLQFHAEFCFTEVCIAMDGDFIVYADGDDNLHWIPANIYKRNCGMGYADGAEQKFRDTVYQAISTPHS